MTLRLVLVRHGLSTFNCEQRIQGRNDLSVLTNEGHEQAIQTGKVLAELPINAVYSSPLKRAFATTKNILLQRKEKFEPVLEKNLLEVDLFEWSGLTIKEVQSKHP